MVVCPQNETITRNTVDEYIEFCGRHELTMDGGVIVIIPLELG